MTNHKSGHDAEELAAEYLRQRGFKILETNWKTRYCEVDLVAKKKKRIYLVEVKSRRTSNQGSGTDYITPKKLKQMEFAAQMWVNHHQWPGEYQLAVLAIDNGDVTFIEDL